MVRASTKPRERLFSDCSGYGTYAYIHTLRLPLEKHSVLIAMKAGPETTLSLKTKESDDVVTSLPGPSIRQPRRRQKQLSTDSLNWAMPSNRDVNLHVQEQAGEHSWRYWVVKMLHGRRMQIFLASLLLLDVVILFCELALMTLFPACNLVERDAISCCPTNDSNEAARWLAGSEDDTHYSCAPGLEPRKDFEATCDTHKHHTVHAVETAFVSLTITILTIFFLELNLLMIAVRPAIFFRQMFYSLDYFIVTVSLGLEVAFFGLGDEVLASLVGLFITARLWRFVRIGHGIVELTEDLAHEKHVQEQVYTKELEFLLEQHGIPLPPPPKDSGHGNHCELVERVENQHLDKLRKNYHHQVTSGS